MDKQSKSKKSQELPNQTALDQQNKSWIVCLSTFPPRQCGIATFTTDFTNALDRMFGPAIKSKIVAMNADESSHFLYPNKVIFQINQSRQEDYLNAADHLNRLKEVKLVSIQHEFGIFGGEYGSHLLLFLERIQKPVVTTFHTVLPAPDSERRQIVQAIMNHSKGIIVMTEASKKILENDYGLDPEKIKVIPHGIHHVPYRNGLRAKTAFGLSGKMILSTFGFLSPGKGLEYAILALPQVVEKFPEVRFLIAGVTHPAILEKEGEAYRNSLIEKVRQLGLNNYVSFYNSYFSLSKLLQFLEATDIYLSTSLDPNQAVSGTLSYALGSGRPVISTAFAQAKQDITDDTGLLVGFKDPSAFTKAIIKLASNRELCLQMGKNAYFRTRHMTWENFANSYLKYFSRFVPELIPSHKRLPPIKLDYLSKLTDDFGIIQFAKLIEPDISSGYTLDDNARALMVAVLHYGRFGIGSTLKLAAIYLNFIRQVARPDGYFDNYVGPDRVIDRQRNTQESSEDPSARALYALALVSITKQVPQHFRQQTRSLFKQSFQKNVTFSSPRAIAFYIKALYCLLSKRKNPETLAVFKHHCEQLFDLYEQSRSSDWEWFEHSLTYSNAVLPEALILGYKITGERKYFQAAQKTLDFLIEHTFKDGLHVPIGQCGWFLKGGSRQYFDQQPEDVAATVAALNLMFQVTGQEAYKKLATMAFNWFLGDNVLGQVVYDRTTGGCYDGLGEKFINLNQGAESTISYLFSRLSFKN